MPDGPWTKASSQFKFFFIKNLKKKDYMFQILRKRKKN